MADNSRIEDLRKRYHENPRRFFAPLANEYRKAGLLDRAVLLCQKHVPEQPENMNGLVVFGQTLFELGQHDAAREPFTQALKLDPENLIALRHLGDIARLGGDAETAKGWYLKVLELDRRNDEVQDLLDQVGGRDEPASAPPEPISVSRPVFGKGSTVVINAQALADRDRAESEAALPEPASASASAPAPAAAPFVLESLVEPPSAPSAPRVSAPRAIVEPPSARPSKRASLLDIDFDFSETGESSSAKVPPAPAVPAADLGAATLIVEPAPTGDVLGLEPTVAGDALAIETSGDVAPLALEPTIIEASDAPLPELPAGDLELADFSAEVSPLAGLEATEFTSEQVAPMAELETDSVASMSASTVAPLDGLDRPDVSLDSLDMVSLVDSGDTMDAASLSVAADEPASGFDGLADLPLLEDASVEAGSVDSPSARAKPRMTKADLASLPLLADFGLEDDAVPAAASAEPSAPAAPTPVIPTPVVEAAVEPVSASSARAPKATPAFVTETMAALYLKQGLYGEAIGVYRQLVEASPADESLRAKLAELERLEAAESAPKTPDVDMPEFDVPLDATEPEPAAANAALAAVSFGGIGLQGQGTPTPIITPAVSGGPTAREFFGTFARRAVVAAAVVATTAVPAADAHAEPATAVSAASASWPLDALFGAPSDVRDLHAAEVLSTVGSFAGPDGGTGLESLLPTDVETSAERARRSVPRASEMLKFDQFFAKPGTAESAQMPMPSAEPGDDDLDQFQDWLKGLKK